MPSTQSLVVGDSAFEEDVGTPVSSSLCFGFSAPQTEHHSLPCAGVVLYSNKGLKALLAWSHKSIGKMVLPSL